METYTFTFKYAQILGGTTEVSSLEIQGPDGELVTVQNAKYAASMLTRRLITLCTALPDLPGTTTCLRSKSLVALLTDATHIL